MKRILATAILLLAVGACSSESNTPGQGGGGTSTTTTTTTTTSTTTTSVATCDAALAGECGDCMKGACCDVLTDCEADPDCVACVTGADTAACEKSPETHDRGTAYLTCKGGACQSACIGGTGGTCVGVLDGVVNAACGTCLTGSCCDEVAACNAHEGCWNKCFATHDETACHGDADGHALYHALLVCLEADCSTPCLPPTLTPACDAPATAPSGGACVTLGGEIECNPVSSEGCTGAGYACDVTNSGGFQCYPPPNENAICAACSEADGFCAAGLTCTGGKCARYCCEDGDCGTGHCDKTTVALGSVGVCAI